jgi:hypothetical protein
MLAVALLGAACTLSEKGKPVASAQPPQDVWQLADQLVQRVPLTAENFADLLGTPLEPNRQNPLRLDGGPVEFNPSLRVTSSVIAIIDGTWSFAAIDIDPNPCITEEDVRAHHPDAELSDSPSGHSSMEEFVWTVSYDWGDLGFGIREANRCLVGLSVKRAKP